MKFKFIKLFCFALSILFLFSAFPANIYLQERTISSPTYCAFLNVDTVIAGDIDGDTETTNQDLIRLFQYLSGWDVDVVELALDVDNDAEATNQDLIRLFQYLSGWDVEVYPQCNHTGGVATCKERAICDICHQPYGKLDSNNHIHTTECPAVTPTCHTAGNTAYTKCTDCGKILSDSYEILPINPDNHTGNTAIKNQREASCTKDGYTGDTYCADCGATLSEGEVINKTGHAGGNATYYQKAICDNCHEEYGDYAQMYAYESLTDNQKRIYNILDDKINNLETEFDLTDYLTADEAVENLGTNTYTDKNGTHTFWEEGWEQNQFNATYYSRAYLNEAFIAFKALNSDRPEYFWMPDNLSINGSIRTRNGIQSYKIIAVLKYSVSKAEKEQMSVLFEAEVGKVVSLTENLDSDFEKEIAIHDYICENTVYDHDTADLIVVDESEPYKKAFKDQNGNIYYVYYNQWSFTAYGALVDGLAVCEGYSRAMQLICQRIGIPCGLITGIAKEEIEEEDEIYIYETPHMWNIINPGDGCYYLDVTFDDPTNYEGPCLHTYFNKTEADMEDHIFNSTIFEESVTSDYNYFDTHGDNTTLEYYTATGAYIGAGGVASAVEFIQSHSDMVYFDIMFDNKLYTHLTVRNALMTALNLSSFPDYIECTDNVIAIILS